jgi:hypothetical protein
VHDHHSPADGDKLAEALAGGPIQPQQALALLGDIAGEDGPVADRLEDASGRTQQYVSPERILGRDEGPAADVYSLTALLHRCLTGKVPFPQGRGRAVRFWHLHAPRPSATKLRWGLPPAIDRVIARGMATDPAARHPTPQALIDDAREALEPAAADAAHDTGPFAAADSLREPRELGIRGSRTLALIAAGAVALAAGAAGFVVAGMRDEPQPRSPVARTGPIQLAAPADWSRSPTPASAAGLELVDPVSLAPTSSAGTRLLAGVAPPAASVALLRRLGAEPPDGELVSLGATQARRYRAAHLPGGTGPVTVYVAPAFAGIATVACLAGGARAAPDFMARCERVAGTLRLSPRPVAPAGPTGGQIADLRTVFRRINSARARHGAKLERSATAAGQAAAARALVRAHVRGEQALRALRLTGLAQPGGQAAVRALKRSARAYRAAARAAVAGDRGDYATARRAAAAADADLRRALAMLRVVGYGA